VILSVSVSVIIVVVSLFVAPALLGIIYGSGFVRDESVNAFSALVWIVPVLAARRNGRTALITLNRQHTDFWISIAGILLMLCMVIPATFVHGITGTAWAMVISELITAIVTWLYLINGLRQVVRMQAGSQQP
jgi:Na+-driven multidrug efflux pump